MVSILLPLLLPLLPVPHDDPVPPAAVRPAGPAAVFLHRGGLRRDPTGAPTLAAALARLAQGPSAAQRQAGYHSALPAGTRLLDWLDADGVVTITFSDAVLGRGDLAARADDLVGQVAATVGTARPDWRSLRIRVQTPAGPRDLASLLPPAAKIRRTVKPMGPALDGVPGALTGRTIVISPGHGLYWHKTYRKFLYQRPLIDGLIEDVHNNEIAYTWIIPALENMGARVISCRERQTATAELIPDNDDGAPVYTETGSWATSSWQGYAGRTYRYATAAATETATATWSRAVPAAGTYGVYAWYRAGANRAPDATYRIEHSGGTDQVTVNQRLDGSRWVWLGAWHFAPGKPARITLSNRSTAPGGAIIADAVRIGGGLGSIDRGGGPSREPRWRECARYWTQYAGAPSSVWSRGSSTDNGDDVTTRPAYAEWRGADAYVSHHTNAGGGTGTSSFIYSGGATAGSATLQKYVHDQMIGDIRTLLDPAWTDRGKKSANFGEVRVLATMPGVLVEAAFHDDPQKKDHAYLHDPDFRRIEGRAIARGVMRYFSPTAPLPPEPPVGLRVTNNGRGGLTVAWEASPRATSYTVEHSTDGKGYAPAATVAATRWDTPALPFDSVHHYRVRAVNASGRSFPTETLGGRVAAAGKAALLVVNGFDRFGRYVREHENTRDYTARHGRAVAAVTRRGYAYDSCSNEAVTLGRVALGAYRVVDWLLGEESQADHTLDAQEQFLVGAYLRGGGALLITGSELAWDLDARGSSGDRLFLKTVLGVGYVADDAGSYGHYGAAGSSLAGLPPGSFDNGTQGTYDVDYPDVLAPAATGARVCLHYGNAKAAGVEWDQGTWRTVTLGFPLETVVGDTARADLLGRALAFLDRTPDIDATPQVARGKAGTIDLDLPAEFGRPYIMAAALSRTTGIPLGDGRAIPLDMDPLFLATVGTGGGLFTGFAGTLNLQGRAGAGWTPPNLAALVGLPVHFAAFTVDLAGPAPIRRVTTWATSVIR